jgi:hypothetical protein
MCCCRSRRAVGRWGMGRWCVARAGEAVDRSGRWWLKCLRTARRSPAAARCEYASSTRRSARSCRSPRDPVFRRRRRPCWPTEVTGPWRRSWGAAIIFAAWLTAEEKLWPARVRDAAAQRARHRAYRGSLPVTECWAKSARSAVCAGRGSWRPIARDAMNITARGRDEFVVREMASPARVCSAAADSGVPGDAEPPTHISMLPHFHT